MTWPDDIRQSDRSSPHWGRLILLGSLVVGLVGILTQWSTILHDNPSDTITRLNAITFAENYFVTAPRDPELAWQTMVTEEFRRTHALESTPDEEGYRDFWKKQSGVAELTIRTVDGKPGAFLASFHFVNAAGKTAKGTTTLILTLVCQPSAWSLWPRSECAPERIQINSSARPDPPVPTATPTPTPTRTPTTPSTPTPSPTSADPLMQANVGVMPDGFTLPGARPAYASMDKLWACAFRSARFTALGQREASRVALAQGTTQGSFSAIGVVLFANENQAASFLLELAKEAVNCPPRDPEGKSQWRQTFVVPKGEWGSAVFAGYRLTPLSKSTDVTSSGALFLAALKGRAVAFYTWNGLGQKAPAADGSDENYAAASREVLVVLDQLD